MSIFYSLLLKSVDFLPFKILPVNGLSEVKKKALVSVIFFIVSEGKEGIKNMI